ncbi:uncharacterized protein BJ171DRAFT_564131 [Polychytrium aggregatum]|uniref:uncharacterized protein n=1 Tax=Polychytrium aggregatum TaxID=110093 RepID=UPI0022FE9438|nr:uncharacterized protein BJ171DRAFT_564131 [Polychytrium aggregatum]KAI9209578.1 hypothetical protein BJ171DRAFT_564131 [Polychytrium aggregatum]
MYPYMPMPFYPTAFQPTMPPPTQYQNWTLPTHSPQPQYRAPPAASSSRGPAFFHDGAPTGLGAECHLCSTCPCGYYGHSCHPGHCHVCEHSHSHQTSHSHSRRCSECRRRRKKKHRNARSESSPSNSASQQESRSKRSSKGKGKVVSPTPSADEDSIVEEIIGAPDSHSQSESQELPVQDRNDPPRRTLPSEPESSKSQELRGCHERRYRCSTCSHHGRSDRPSKQQQHSTGSSPQHYQSYIEHAQSTSLLGDDSLSLIATFHPNIFVLNNLLASHLRLIQDFVKMNQKLNEDEQNASHYVRYTTLEDTKREIESRRKPELTFEEALEQVKRDS